MAIMAMLRREPLPAPTLKITSTKVAQLLDHLQAVQRLNQEIHDDLLAKARQTPNLVVKCKPASEPRREIERYNQYLDALMRS